MKSSAAQFTCTPSRSSTGPTVRPDAIAHGYLAGGPVALFGADVSGDEPPFRSGGMMLALLGTAAPSTLRDRRGGGRVAGVYA